MRIAYIAEYQGPGLIGQRGIKRHRSLAQSMKIELIANILYSSGHEIDIISQGVVLERKGKYFPSINETELFHPNIPIYYSSAFDIRVLRGICAKVSTLNTFKGLNKDNPYDIVIIYNLKDPQIKCANFAINRLKIPVILELEDDSFVTKSGETNISTKIERRKALGLLKKISGCMAVSPYLLNKILSNVPKLLLRGIVGEDLFKLSGDENSHKMNWILYAGGHDKNKGTKQLITAWRDLDLPGWKLHITGYGSLTEELRKMAQDRSTIAFHGLTSREKLVRLMCSSKICINPHDISHTPGNVFAFKIIEYLAAGAHVITTPMGTLEEEIEQGITYMHDNNPEAISATIGEVIATHKYANIAMEYVHRCYNPRAVSRSLNELIQQAVSNFKARNI